MSIVWSVDALLGRYASSRLAALSDGHRRATLRVLNQLCAAAGGAMSTADGAAVRQVLSDGAVAGHGAGTLRKHRTMMRAFIEWSHAQGYTSAECVLSVRAVALPVPWSRATKPRAYRRKELAELWATLDERWPRLPEDEAWHWLGRWLDGRSPYARVRTHLIRSQLDAIIALAMQCGLRPGEIFRQRMVFMHSDNEHVVVWRHEGPPWEGHYRTVHYTDSARAMIAAWCMVHYVLGPSHDSPWLALHAEPTVRDAMSRESFDRLLRTYVGQHWTLSRLRATCGVTWAKAGLHPEHLRRVLGYASVGEIWPYLEQVGGDEARHMDRLDGRFTELVEVA